MRNILIVLCLLLTELNVSAYDFEVDGFYYNITSLTDLTVALTGKENNNVGSRSGEIHSVGTYSGNVVVPQNVTWNGKTFIVNEILWDAFQECTLGSLTVPSSVLLMHLGNAKIGKLIIEDGDELLRASRYKEYDLYDNNSMCKDGHIEEIYLGRNSPSRFDDADTKKITFGNNVTEIAGYMFNRCDITGTITLPKNIKKINGDNAFNENVNLVEVIAPGVEYIGQQAFSNCTSLKKVDAPNLKYIGSGAFERCTSLTSFEIPQGVRTIGAVAFDSCANLETIIIPNSIVNFGDVVYYNVTYNQIFRDCSALKSITVNAATPFELEESNFDALTYINATLHIPSEALDAYKNAPVWKNFFNICGNASSDDNVCSIIINGCSSSYGGYIEISDEKYTDSDAVITAKKGESITLKFIPNSHDYEKYELEAVKVNDVDVTRNVVDNELTIEVTGNMTIDISWDYAEEAPVFLSIKYADNGNIKLKVSKWDEYDVIFEPAEDWNIHSVSFNGTDVTNEVSSDNSYRTPEITENSELIVVYVSDMNAIDEVHSKSSLAKVIGSSGNIIISNAEEGERVYVYTTAGVLVNTAVTHNGTTTIRVQENEVYIVKVGNKTFKVGI